MGCNAWNHPPGCRCGWGGDGHKGKSPGGWQGGGYAIGRMNHSLTTYSDTETDNRATTCPKCGSNVFFIRHNGGSVWLDPPLSPPWYKHPCFDYETAGEERRALFKSGNGNQKYRSQSTKLFVVDSCRFSQEFLTTNVKGGFEDGGIYSITLKGDARRFAGILCFTDTSTKEIWPVNDSELKMIFQGRMAKIDGARYIEERRASLRKESDGVRKKYAVKKKEIEQKESYACKLCKSVFDAQKKYRKHLRKAHNVIEISFYGHVTGFLICDQNDLGDAEGTYSNKNEKDEENHPKAEFREIDEVRFLITSSINAKTDDEGWAKLGSVGSLVYQKDPLFKPKNYGFKKLSGLIKSLDYVEVSEAPMKNSPESYEIHVRIR
ncbi:OST-HTH/LOTUS domain protein [Halomonas lysinitropha]|uniref:OST-HTH/LOTUS domain protein n=2 Tax=Halomonas lysinitropha TaxID=2607506 RepID=A0A5K1IBI4_9GAMM|nr:OST-HTH/LOTUS domain protein [Halomonas lysinitropha]